MKRSLDVHAPLLAAAALALLTGCRRTEMKRCVDQAGHVVADAFCADQPVPPPVGTGAGGTGGGYVPLYRYYYGGTGSSDPGTTVTGGSYTPMAGHSYSTGTVRGGFGSAHGDAGGHGGGGGE